MVVVNAVVVELTNHNSNSLQAVTHCFDHLILTFSFLAHCYFQLDSEYCVHG